MPVPMKGLSQFIGDIRNAKVYADEEKRVALELANITAKFADHPSGYQKKKYLTKLLYMHLLGHPHGLLGTRESDELARSDTFSEKQIGYLALLVFGGDLETVRRDLESSNTDFIVLGLQFVANTGAHPELLTLVYSHLRAPTSPPLVRRNACAATLRLLRATPADLTPLWVPRIIAVLDDPDLGVATSGTALALFVAGQAPHLCESLIPLAARRLAKVVLEPQTVLAEYVYDGVPAPWLVTGLLSVAEKHALYLERIGEAVDAASREVLLRVVSRCIQNGGAALRGMRNAKATLLFASIALLVRLNPEPSTVTLATSALLALLSSTDTNTRYLALDALTRLSQGYPTQTSDQLETVLGLLEDRDISIRRQALALLCAVTGPGSVERVAASLLKYLQTADYTLRPELATSLAALCETHASDAAWYVATLLRLIATAGPHVKPAVGQRVVQILVNNTALQPLAVQLACTHAPDAGDPMVLVVAFILGEFGLDEATHFELLRSRYYYCAPPTRALVLLAFLKMYVRNETLRPQILDFFELEVNSIDVEIQTRASEYLRLATFDDGAALPQVVRLMPVFTRESEVQKVVLETPATPLSANWQEGYHRGLHFDQGILFENAVVRIMFRLVKRAHVLEFQLSYKNKTTAVISGLTAVVRAGGGASATAVPVYLVEAVQAPASDIAPLEKTDHRFEVSVRDTHSAPSPVLLVSFMCGAFSAVRVKLPVVLLRTLTPAPLAYAGFLTRWGQLGGAYEGRAAFTTSLAYPIVSLRRVMARIGFSLVDPGEYEAIPETELVLGTGILHTLGGNYGSLLVMEVGRDGREFVLKVRCTAECAESLVATIEGLLCYGV